MKSDHCNNAKLETERNIITREKNKQTRTENRKQKQIHEIRIQPNGLLGMCASLYGNSCVQCTGETCV